MPHKPHACRFGCWKKSKQHAKHESVCEHPNTGGGTLGLMGSALCRKMNRRIPGGNKVYRLYGYSDSTVGLKVYPKDTELTYRAGVPAAKQKSKGVNKSFGVADWKKEKTRHETRKRIIDDAIRLQTPTPKKDRPVMRRRLFISNSNPGDKPVRRQLLADLEPQDRVSTTLCYDEHRVIFLIVQIFF